MTFTQICTYICSDQDLNLTLNVAHEALQLHVTSTLHLKLRVREKSEQ